MRPRGEMRIGIEREVTGRFFSASQNNEGFLQPLLCDKREKSKRVIIGERMKYENK